MQTYHAIIRHQLGMTIIEMLIALVILSIGMLGIAALQSRGQQYNLAAHIRTQATILGEELIERIRLNPDPNGDGVRDDYAIDPFPSSPPDVNCETTECSPDELRDFDLITWENRVQDMFPNSQVSVFFNTSGANGARFYTQSPSINRLRYEIRITWQLSDGEQENNEVDAANSTTKTMLWVMTP